jgi:heme oxygenase (biliverdin-producing, ferredoxin)
VSTASSSSPVPFSRLIRDATRAQHAEAESSAFMADLLGGRLGKAAYAGYTQQLWFVYRALEAGARALAGDPVAGPFLRPELSRLAGLERDLDHLYGPGWREFAEPLPATAAYGARIDQVAAQWPAGYVAHHYTRYLGDLSGGQVIRGIAEREWGFERGGDGVRFYVFDGIDNPARFKREYRAALDALEPDDLTAQLVVEECRQAFRLNNAVFADLARAFPPAA